jgi:small subunit ribosomal protein S4
MLWSFSMVHYTGPKNRISRRFGINMFGRAKNPLVHKPNPPGQHGAKHKKKSDYGIALDEKQKLKAAFGMITEKQLVNYYEKASLFHKKTPEILLQMLDARLDITVYRMKFTSSIFQAQQLVSHGHVCVDGKKVDIRSFQVKPGMVVSIKPASQKISYVKEALEATNRAIPGYLEVDSTHFSGKMLAVPAMEDISLPVEVSVPHICDFLAHNA